MEAATINLPKGKNDRMLKLEKNKASQFELDLGFDSGIVCFHARVHVIWLVLVFIITGVVGFLVGF